MKKKPLQSPNPKITKVKTMDKNQFYPTPANLANKMIELFDDPIGKGSVVLEPSAGRANLIKSLEDREKVYRGQRYNVSMPKSIDVVESDPDNIAILQSMKDINIVGYDFLEFETRKMYTHVLMNPPFDRGVSHLLKAWEILRNGELVAVINAENIKNPNDKYKKHLVQLIEDHNGTVEYLKNEFLAPDVMRKTTVEVALIHLSKETAFDDSYIDGLKPDIGTPVIDSVEATDSNIAIPEPAIDQSIKIYNAAATCLLNELTISAQLKNSTTYYYGLLADSLIRSKDEIRQTDREHVSREKVIADYNVQNEALKEKAWSQILKASKLTEGLSSKIVEKIHSEFKEIAKLEFTKSNIHGFLANLMAARQSGSIDMMCSVFDQFTQYSTGNRAFYKGWKSNDKHKANAFKLKTTRFITTINSMFQSISWSDLRSLNDLDLAFATLDGKQRHETIGVSDLLDNKETLAQLRTGERLSATYFDVRYYPGATTVHIFPNSKTLIDRLNRIVGQHRQWLPDVDERVPEQFWIQYQGAEKIQSKLDKNSEYKKMSEWGRIHDESNIPKLEKLITLAGEQAGFDMEYLLDNENCPALPRLVG